MKIEIEGKKENPLLERTEVNFSVEHEGASTPIREEIRTQLAGKLGVNKDTIIIDRMNTEFGRQLTKGYAKVYDSVESAKKFEKEHLLARNKLEGGESQE